MSFLGWPELIVILAILLLIFGGSRLKGLAKGLGESVREFKKATSGEEEDEDTKVIEAAKKLGIKTEGKETSQILREMNTKIAEKEAQ
jgi:sec-independent protein translocase protein TatA